MSEQETFDGQEIAGYVAALPPMKLEAPDSYQRGTYMTLQVEVRVKSVRYEEVTSGKNKGDLVKVHILATEDVKILGVLTPKERLAILEAQVAEAEADVAAAEKQVASVQTSGSNTEPEETDTWEYAEPEGVQGVREEVAAGF